MFENKTNSLESVFTTVGLLPEKALNLARYAGEMGIGHGLDRIKNFEVMGRRSLDVREFRFGTK